jgi:mono/diheme cytochrome c family protein
MTKSHAFKPATCATVLLVASMLLSTDAHGKSAPATPKSATGAELFSAHCASCHGVAGRGGRAPDLRGTDLPVADIRDTVVSGVPREMPAFGKTLNAAQVTAVVAYVKALPPAGR